MPYVIIAFSVLPSSPATAPPPLGQRRIGQAQRDPRRLRHFAYIGLFIENSYSLPGLVTPINQFSAKVGWTREERVDRSDRIDPYPDAADPRRVRIRLRLSARPGDPRRLPAIERADLKANIPVEIRFVAADDTMLSPTYRRAACYIGAYTFGAQFADPYFDAFEGYMKSLGARGHWGKFITLSPDEARAQYPELDRFREIRRRMDPNNLFLNAFLTPIFGG